MIRYTTPFVKYDDKILCYSASRHAFTITKFDGRIYKPVFKENIGKYVLFYKNEIKKRLSKITDLPETKEITEYDVEHDYVEDMDIKEIPYTISLPSGLYYTHPVISRNNKKFRMKVYKITNNGLPDKNGVIKYFVYDKEILKEVFEANDKLLSYFVYSL